MEPIFRSFSLPNPVTWFYFALILAVAIFFQFRRPFALRNFDLLALFVFVPGFLLIEDSHRPGRWPRSTEAELQRFLGYVWLLSACGYWFVRCLLDLAAPRRSLVRANLSFDGLAWFGGTLFLSLGIIAISKSADPFEPVGKIPATISSVTETTTTMVQNAQVSDRFTARQWVERSLAVAAHLAVVLGLVCIGGRHYRDWETGLGMGTLYLLLPFTAYLFGQMHHVLPTALVIWSVYMYRQPGWAGLLLGFAAGSAFFPIVLFPVWWHFYWNRGGTRFFLGFLSATAIGVGITLAVLGIAGEFPSGLGRHLHLQDWQPWRVPNTESLWTAVHWAYRLPVFIVFGTLVVLSFFWPAVRNLGQLLAMTAALLIG
ncbi:MAG: hypothetical protein ACRCZF_06795, partial [Gemmataceae bacterium]